MPPKRRTRWKRAADSVGRHPIAWKSGAAVIIAAGAIFTSVFTFDGIYQRQTAAQSHARDDVSRALWTQYGMAQLRAGSLEDRVYDLAARKAALGNKFPIADDVSLQRYRAQLDQQVSRLTDLRKQIDDLNRESK